MSPRRLAATRRMQYRRRVERGVVETIRAVAQVGHLQGDTIVIDETGHITIHGWRGSDTTITPTIGVRGGR